MRYIIEQIELIKRKDPAIRSNIEVILYPSFWAILFHKIAHYLYLHERYFIARLLSQISRFFTGIEIHPGAKIGKNFFIDHGLGVVIGETCEIGDNVLIYQGVTLGGTGKDIGKRHPTIGNDVLIGAGAKVLGPFKIGDNARIGAGTVVLQEVPPNSTVIGIPGKPVKRKSNEQNASNSIDLVKIPDPVSIELCQLRNKLESLEKKIQKLELEKKEND